MLTNVILIKNMYMAKCENLVISMYQLGHVLCKIKSATKVSTKLPEGRLKLPVHFYTGSSSGSFRADTLVDFFWMFCLFLP